MPVPALPASFAIVMLFLALASLPARAAIAFDPVGGVGNVDASDVQLVLGWTETELKERAAIVSFSYQGSTSYSAVCAAPATTSGGVPAQESRNFSIETKAPILSMPRFELRTGVVEAFTLNGYASTGQGQEAALPSTGTPCRARSGAAGTWTSVIPTGRNGVLQVEFAGRPVRLPF